MQYIVTYGNVDYRYANTTIPYSKLLSGLPGNDFYVLDFIISLCGVIEIKRIIILYHDGILEFQQPRP